jgi:hypothetical protein
VEKQSDDKGCQKLQDTFAALAATIAPKKPKNGKVSPRVRKPNFSTTDDTYAPLICRIQSELHARELHSNFDYLSFYRRAFELVLRVRGEVLFDTIAQIARRADIKDNPDPDNFSLIFDFLSALGIKPKGDKIDADKGDEVFTDVVPLNQLGRIAKLMETLIRKDGSMESYRADLRLKSDWVGFRTSYAAEDALHSEDSPDVDHHQVYAEPLDTHPGATMSANMDPRLEASEEIGNLDCRPPSSWPQDIEMDLGSGHDQSDPEVATHTLTETVNAFEDFMDDVSP